MSEADLQTIYKKASKGFLSLTFRKAALLAISYITNNLILARILPVEVIGIFNIGTSVIVFFSYFSDVGLAAAIIQKKDKITEEDLKTTFTVQSILVSLILLVVFIFAPQMANFYHLDNSGMWLIRFLAFSFFITSLKVVPAVILERDLKFGPLITVEVIETLVFNIGLISLVKMGYGLDAFSYSALARAVVGVASIYIVAPWKVGLHFSKSSAKALLNFGIPFQLNSFLALIKDRLVPLVVAGIVGPTGIGFITWSQNIAWLPLEIMSIVIRVSFPAFSRVQSDPKALKQLLERSLFLTTLFLYPALFGILALAPALIEFVVSKKWTPALTSIYLFSLSTFWAALSTTFTNTLNAIGNIKTTLKLMVFWTALTWVLTVPLTYLYGFEGVAISSALISFTSIITIILVKRHIEVEIIKSIWQPLSSAIVMGGLVYLFSQLFVRNIPTLLASILFGLVVYLLIISLTARKKVKAIFGDFKYAFSEK